MNNRDLNQPLTLKRVLIDREAAERCLLDQTRRKFLTSAFGSLGSLALGSMLGPKLLAAPRESSAAEALAEGPIKPYLTHAQGQARYPPMYGRRPEPPRNFRL